MSRRRILVFGDSNSWGFVPRSDEAPTTRFEREQRWPGVLADRLGAGYEVIEEALSGRTTTLDDPQIDLPAEALCGQTMNGSRLLPGIFASHLPLDLVLIMLGTNDLKTRFSRGPSEIALAALSLVHLLRDCAGGVHTSYPTPPALLIAPPSLGKHFHHPEEWSGSWEKSLMLGAMFKDVARTANVPFFDAGEVVTTDGEDGIHLTAEAHRQLGEALAEPVKALLMTAQS